MWISWKYYTKPWMKPHITHNLAFFKSYLSLYIHFKWTWTMHHPTDVNRKHVKIHLLNSLIKSKFVLSLILYYNSFNLQKFDWLQRYRCCFASRFWEECYSTVFNMIQRKFQRSRMVIVIVVTPLNLYKIEPGATFIWIDMQIFRNFHHNFSFFS